MNEVISLLALPTETLVALAGGYIGYRLVAIGKDATHTNIDVVFGSLVFALVSQLASSAASSYCSSVYLQATAGLLGAALAASVWRKWGEDLFSNLCRKGNVSISDRHRTAWDPLRVDPKLQPVQIIVRRKDGVQLMCERLSAFNDKKTKACRFGADGSVALYVTHALAVGAENWEDEEVEGEDDWGALMTYVPASEIAQLMVRY